jgi:hypothetical protein
MTPNRVSEPSNPLGRIDRIGGVRSDRNVQGLEEFEKKIGILRGTICVGYDRSDRSNRHDRFHRPRWVGHDPMASNRVLALDFSF